jgi:nicotinamidase-related amidase
MYQALLIVDVQTAFGPPDWLVKGIQALANQIPSVATIELHDEEVTFKPIELEPSVSDENLVQADQLFVKHGFGPSAATMQHLKQLNPERVLVCGIQTETCVLAAGYSLFDAGLRPTLITDLTVGSSLDRSGQLGISLWKHHFRLTVSSGELAMEFSTGGPVGSQRT